MNLRRARIRAVEIEASAARCFGVFSAFGGRDSKTGPVFAATELLADLPEGHPAVGQWSCPAAWPRSGSRSPQTECFIFEGDDLGSFVLDTEVALQYGNALGEVVRWHGL